MESNFVVVFLSQEFDLANHKELWENYWKYNQKKVVIVNISSDIFVTSYTKKFYRIIDSFKGIKTLNERTILIRPFFIIRPELGIKFFKRYYQSKIERLLKKITNISVSKFDFVFYNPVWARILYDSNSTHTLNYYIVDEYRLFADNNKINPKMLSLDIAACKLSTNIFAISKGIIVGRDEFTRKITVIGNGSTLNQFDKPPQLNTFIVGFFGIFRNWIDKGLLTRLISENSDIQFHFAGLIDKDMKKYFNNLVTNYRNFRYFGFFQKQYIYDSFLKDLSIVIVPYIQNDFIKATRPIKIVESIFYGIPVVSTPLFGYEEQPFLKFASNYDEFINAIRSFKGYNLNKDLQKHALFVKENSWETISLKINSLL